MPKKKQARNYRCYRCDFQSGRKRGDLDQHYVDHPDHFIVNRHERWRQRQAIKKNGGVIPQVAKSVARSIDEETSTTWAMGYPPELCGDCLQNMVYKRGEETCSPCVEKQLAWVGMVTEEAIRDNMKGAT